MHSCLDCDISFSTRGNLQRHRREVHSTSFEAFVCFVCGLPFVRTEHLQRHVNDVHRQPDGAENPSPPRRTMSRDDFQEAKRQRVEPGLDDAFLDYSPQPSIFSSLSNILDVDNISSLSFDSESPVADSESSFSDSLPDIPSVHSSFVRSGTMTHSTFDMEVYTDPSLPSSPHTSFSSANSVLPELSPLESFDMEVYTDPSLPSSHHTSFSSANSFLPELSPREPEVEDAPASPTPSIQSRHVSPIRYSPLTESSSSPVAGPSVYQPETSPISSDCRSPPALPLREVMETEIAVVFTRRDIPQADGTSQTTRETAFTYTQNVNSWTRQDFADEWEKVYKDCPNFFKK